MSKDTTPDYGHIKPIIDDDDVVALRGKIDEFNTHVLRVQEAAKAAAKEVTLVTGFVSVAEKALALAMTVINERKANIDNDTGNRGSSIQRRIQDAIENVRNVTSIVDPTGDGIRKLVGVIG
ncbi:MAG: hypothetical protein KIPDCIKN_04375 [Haliscomenobacter sp.]|nr:hypothetical protein [Haliscomenobacter sp.]